MSPAAVQYTTGYLMERVVVTEAGCWEWQGGLDRKGYGRFRTHVKSTGAHRFSWVVHNGPIPDGLHVLHHCDNPPCCNPDHLFLGTNADNVADMMAKGRQAKGVVGHDNPRSKLTREHAMEIKTRTDKGVCALAMEYRVSAATVSCIRRGIIWKCLASSAADARREDAMMDARERGRGER